ncbi:MAG: Spy/CpxP family protein refolding chaperone [Gemmatimonadota bacterium]
MRSRIAIIAGTLLLAASLPLAAQEPSAPPSLPAIERLEKLRLERLQESLGLNGEQTAALRGQMEASRAAMRESFERQKQATGALEKSLGSQPADQDALRRSLAEVEAAREQMEGLHRQHMEGLERALTPEQRAKFLLFNLRFDSRLRELVEQHRAHGREGDPHGNHDGAAAPRGMPGWGPDPGQATREQKIEWLEKRIGEMQRELEELRSGSDD